MRYLNIFLGYLKWHYGKALVAVFTFWKNILIFLFNYFSIKSLLGNFFTPWKRLVDSYPKNFNLQAYFFAFIANAIMRVVGMIFRSVVLIIGLTCCAIFIILLPISLVVWLVFPFIIAWLILYGLILIISSILVIYINKP